MPMVVADGDDRTSWDLVADVYEAIPSRRKRFEAAPPSRHLTLYEDGATARAVLVADPNFFSPHL
jgi:hypothetical protein